MPVADSLATAEGGVRDEGWAGGPLEAVEEIYADYNYPPTIQALVRYMAPRARRIARNRPLIDRWARFLELEGRSLEEE